jgi:predicted nucleotidyltransferase
LLVDRGAFCQPGLFPLVALEQDLEASIGEKVDILTTKAIRENSAEAQVIQNIERDKVMIYESI